ncbi:CHASE domain-containing hybrid sensor histidine kinase/response regulator [Aeromonas caviae]|uniref:CHASE domain-containing hybrid sensor histidine kinase/response regulator n=1 Tax=Aeromonas caviae TaxID=648 RepID=UPI002B46E7B9|nr:PAS domain S-box protein [Aeromonas caviae]
MALQQQKLRIHAGRRGILVFLSGLLLTAGLTLQLDRKQEQDRQEAYQNFTTQFADTVEERITRYQYGLRGARGAILVAGEQGISRADFRRYSASRDMKVEFPGARGFGFIRRVPLADEAAFVARARQDDAPGFAIRQLQPHAGERYVVQYVEPQAGNQQAIGLDIASEANRKAAADAAMRSGQVQLTAPITLVQAMKAPSKSFMMLMPIYRDGMARDSEAQRVAATLGWSYASILMDEVMGAIRINPELTQFTLSDVSDPRKPVVFYASRAADGAVIGSRSVTKTILGRTWQIEVRFQPAFLAGLHQNNLYAVGLLGVLASLGFTIMVFLWSSRRLRQQQLIDAQARMAAIVESSIDGIIGKTLQGVVISWNRGAEEIFGYRADEALGKTMAQLVVPDDLAYEEEDILARICRGERLVHFTTRRRHKNGQLIDVSVSVSPIIDDSGRIVGASKTVRDISEQVAIERQMKELNAYLEEMVATRTAELDRARRVLRTVLDAVPSMIGYWDKQLVNRVANHAYHTWFGVDPDTLPGMSMVDLLGKDLFAANRPHIDAVLRGDEQTFERAILGPDGKERHSLAHYIPDWIDGEVQGFYMMMHDVTELVEGRQQLAAALRENQVLLQTINEQLLYSVSDPNGVIIEANDQFCLVLGYTREEIIGRDHHLFSSGLHPAAFWQNMWDTVLANKAWHGEICNKGKDGSLLWFDTVIAPCLDSEGQLERFVALRIDVTERRAADEERKRLNVLLGNVLRSASEVSIIATDQDGRITIFNSGAQSMLGYQEDEMVGRCTLAMIHLPDEVNARGEELSRQYGQAIEGFRVFVHVPEFVAPETREWTYVCKDGSWRRVTLAVTAMRDEQGVLTGYLGIATDITIRKQFENSLELARQQAEQANVAKSQFLANMSHEIRTPMNAVLGMLQLVRQTPLDTRQQDYVVKAQSAAQSLLALLNDILDFSKIDAGKLELDIHAFSLEDMLRELAVVLSGNQHHKTVELMFEVDPSLPLEVRGDKLRILQILINLGGNALKFTEAGQVVIHLSALRQDAASVTLQVSVTDTGIGITPEQLSRIFNGFTQAESSTTRRFGGSGLGLVICQRLVALMGSELRVDSEPGRGSCFSFELCLEVENKALSISVVAPDISHCHVLVVDDSEISREILVNTIEMRGWSCDAVESGAKALVKFISALKAGRPYDVVLVDWRMPEMDGVATAKLIKQQFPDVACPVVIMLSAYGRELLGKISEQDRVIFRDILTKPITPQQLIASIARARQPAQRDSLPPVFELPQRLAGVRLLLVEDNALNRQVAGELLTHEGASVVMAEDGLQGVRIATQQPDAFDIIIMDMQMPVMDGLQATREIRAVPVLAALPILAMTANASQADREACLQAGMNDHVGKPIDIDEVVELILKLVQGKAVPAAGTERQPAAASETATAAEVDPLDRLMRRFGQNLNVYRQTLASFSIEACNQLDMLARQREAADVPRMAATFHALKGVAATVGATALAAQAAEWERQSRTEEAAEFCTRFDTEQLAALRELATRSEQLLMQALPEPQPEATVIPDIAATLSRPEWLERLRALLPPLESGNLEALDLLAALPASPPEERETMQEVAALVQSLQFPGAVTIIRRILERET